jgi:hypothetical protein
VGYFRFDTPAELLALTRVYRYLCPLYNYRSPSFRFIDKVKQADGHYRKVYGKQPKTPYRCLMESPDISRERNAELRRRERLTTCRNTMVNAAMDKLLRINRGKGQNDQFPCQGNIRPGTA